MAEFLATAFGVSKDASFLRPDVLDWKFFAPRPDWSGPRSYVVKQDAQIIAHSCIWPVSFRLPDRSVSSMHLIDWAASKSAAGAGIFLNQELMKQTDTAVGIGGSDISRKIAPRIGFSHVGSLSVYARVVRPWRQFRAAPDRFRWKGPLRLARNGLWALLPACPPPKHLSAAPVAAFDHSLDWLFGDRTASPYLWAARTPELLNYILRCPAVISRAFLVYDREKPCGYFVLARAGGQTRIADLWIQALDEESWAGAYSLAVRRAAEDAQTCEIAAYSSTALVEAALLRNGFRLRAQKPVFLNDRKRHLDCGLPLSFSGLESDAFFLYNSGDPFLT